MTTRHRHLVALAALALLALLALLAGCAGNAREPDMPPAAAAPAFPDAASIGPGMGCAQLREAASRADDAREKAAEHQRTSWQVVFPIAVAARYASASSDLARATASFEKASATAAAKNCPNGANG